MTHRRFLLTCAGLTLTAVLTGPVAAAGGPGGGAMRGQADDSTGLERAREVQEQARERHEERERARDGNGMEKPKERAKRWAAATTGCRNETATATGSPRSATRITSAAGNVIATMSAYTSRTAQTPQRSRADVGGGRSATDFRPATVVEGLRRA